MDKDFEVGVVVGRFQLPTIHKGHHYLLEAVNKTHTHLLICVGVSVEIGTRKNPLDYLSRKGMLERLYPCATVVPIMDHSSDKIWSTRLDDMIRSIYPTQNIRLFGGKDSFIDKYLGEFQTIEIYPVDQSSATQIRETIELTPNNEDFRRGVVYAANQQYPRVNMCVDVAMFKWVGMRELHIVLGKRSPDSPLIFPGGHVSPEDESLEVAARRELSEETFLFCNADPRYVGSFIIGDPRHLDPKERIMTALFSVQYNFGEIKVGSDLDHAAWYEVNDELMWQVADHHRILLKALLKSLLPERKVVQ